MSDDDVRICGMCAEPLVWTFEFPGAEWYCVECGAHEDLFGLRAPATPELQRRHDELVERYEKDRAERENRPYNPPRKAGGPQVAVPTCGGCGATPEPGTALVDGKPLLWFSSTRDGVTSYACSRDCIPAGAPVGPW